MNVFKIFLLKLNSNYYRYLSKKNIYFSVIDNYKL